MFRKNDVIIYASQGVCKVVDIRAESFAGRNGAGILRSGIPSLSATSPHNLPTDNDDETNHIRRVLSKEEVNRLISAMSAVSVEWTEDHRIRRQHITEILRSADSSQLILLIRTIYARKEKLADEGKRLPHRRNHAMKDAEQMLFEEFAYSLGIEKEDVPDYIQDISDNCSVQTNTTPHRQDAAFFNDPSKKTIFVCFGSVLFGT
jgi:CarD family transcriptional regulator